MTATKHRSADEILEAVLALLGEYCQQGQEESDSADSQAQNDYEDDQPSVSENGRGLNAQFSMQQAPENERDSLGKNIPPWEDLTGLMPKGLNLPMPPALYAKMLWITNNVPKMSLQKIARAGAEVEANRLIALHYKP